MAGGRYSRFPPITSDRNPTGNVRFWRAQGGQLAGLGARWTEAAIENSARSIVWKVMPVSSRWACHSVI